MKICIPVNEDRGIQSPVCEHFGSAPVFLVVDTDSGDCQAIANTNMHHGHGMCQPLRVLANVKLDGVVVGGIGMGALSKLKAAKIEVYKSEYPTVDETVSAYKAGTLSKVTPATACGQHGHGGQGQGRCGHGHGGGQ